MSSGRLCRIPSLGMKAGISTTGGIWHTLSEAAKIAIAGDADDRASAEDYE